MSHWPNRSQYVFRTRKEIRSDFAWSAGGSDARNSKQAISQHIGDGGGRRRRAAAARARRARRNSEIISLRVLTSIRLPLELKPIRGGPFFPGPARFKMRGRAARGGPAPQKCNAMRPALHRCRCRGEIRSSGRGESRAGAWPGSSETRGHGPSPSTAA